MRQYSTKGPSARLKVRRQVIVGSISVEMVLVTPVLLVLLFGIIEFGLAFKDIAMLRQAAREGSRAGAVGAVTSAITDRVTASAATLNPENLEIEMKYRVYAGGWPSWDQAATLGDTGSGADAQNNAPQGAQIRIRITYPHSLISGRLFSHWADDPEGQTMTLVSSATMRRE